jgi:hypothetical protein
MFGSKTNNNNYSIEKLFKRKNKPSCLILITISFNLHEIAISRMIASIEDIIEGM